MISTQTEREKPGNRGALSRATIVRKCLTNSTLSIDIGAGENPLMDWRQVS